MKTIKLNIPVECLIERSWNPKTKSWVGRTASGTLIDFKTESSEENISKQITVGIVMLESGAYESVPLEFITTA